jgi:hypothetical protein
MELCNYGEEEILLGSSEQSMYERGGGSKQDVSKYRHYLRE